MTPPSAESVIGIKNRVSDLIVKNFLSLNQITGNENCRIAGILGIYNTEKDFVPDLNDEEFISIVDKNDLFLVITLDSESGTYEISGWSDNDFNKSATEPMTYFIIPGTKSIPITSINPSMELFIDRVKNG